LRKGFKQLLKALFGLVCQFRLSRNLEKLGGEARSTERETRPLLVASRCDIKKVH
jgi:hypothetical protein